MCLKNPIATDILEQEYWIYFLPVYWTFFYNKSTKVQLKDLQKRLCIQYLNVISDKKKKIDKADILN